MDIIPGTVKQRMARSALALGAAALLVTGATWHTFAAETATHLSNLPAVSAEAQQTPAVSRGAASAGGRVASTQSSMGQAICGKPGKK